MEKYNDNTLMPFGTHKDKKLANVPAAYLIWCRRVVYNNRLQPKSPLSVYIEENLDVIKSEIK